MLRIKDNVDLEELEKFGFKLHEKNNVTGYEINYIEPKNGYGIMIFTGYKHLDNCIHQKQLILLYDLITAGLVEKVEEKQ